MSAPKERTHDYAISYEGDVLPNEDYDELIVSNESIVQGIANLENVLLNEALIKEAEQQAKLERERALAENALQNAGVYVTLEEHRQNQLDLVDVASDMSMYRGGEKGGYATDDFRRRYSPKTADVERGARENHKKRVNRDIPRIYMAKQLKEAGFNSYDVDDDVVQMRSQLMSRYGGPANKKARAQWRASLKKQ